MTRKDIIKEFRKLAALEGNDPIRCSRMHFNEWANVLERRNIDDETPWDSLLWDRYSQLRDIHQRLEDVQVRMDRGYRSGEKILEALIDDVRKMRDDVKSEYDSF